MKALERNTLQAVEGLEARTAKLAIAQKATTAALELVRLGMAELVAREKQNRIAE